MAAPPEEPQVAVRDKRSRLGEQLTAVVAISSSGDYQRAGLNRFRTLRKIEAVRSLESAGQVGHGRSIAEHVQVKSKASGVGRLPLFLQTH